ncbi:MFS transporter [Anoxybacillus kestanbolensis]|uniref:MFS transporter n=1 Tax=Anoxybacillus kestanbolensis TaxID=227476 RepID=UPI00208DAD56|nr:MFS transporter [Anoxybacillus kestanbolensis]MCL9969326.1 MFS transporter [Anoxybacillus kestanbolensis]
MNEQFHLLRKYPDFAKIWVTTIFTSFYERAFIVILPVFIYDFTNNSRLVGLASIVESIVIILSGIIGGLLVDRTSTKNLLIVTNILLAIVILLTYFLMNIVPTLSIILALSFIFIFISRTNGIARNAVKRALFDRGRDLAQANAMSGSIFSLSMILGPTVGAAVYTFSGINGLLIIGSIIFISIVFVFRKLNMEVEVKKKNSILKDFNESISSMINNKFILGILFYQVIFIAVGTVFSSLIYIFVKDYLNADANFYSMAIACQGIGNLLGALFYNFFSEPVKIKGNRLIFVYTLLLFFFEAIFLIFQSALLMLISNIFIGIFVQVLMVTSNSVFMEHCTKQNIGRLTGLKNTANHVVSILAVSLSSFAVPIFSVVNVLLFNISLIIVCAFVGLKFIKSPLTDVSKMKKDNN